MCLRVQAERNKASEIINENTTVEENLQDDITMGTNI